jgi:AbrB family looped-hinge helix DNA binding protein
MKTRIDRAGRIVVPKPIREELGLAAGGEVILTVRDGRIEIEPVSVRMRIEDREDGPTIVADLPMPTLTAEQVRDTLERVRRR